MGTSRTGKGISAPGMVDVDCTVSAGAPLSGRGGAWRTARMLGTPGIQNASALIAAVAVNIHAKLRRMSARFRR